MTAWDELSGGLIAPVFFVSYAHVRDLRLPAPPADRDGFVLRFFSDLSLNVNELLSPPIGVDPGFIDRTIGGGDRWRPELLEAAVTCQVLVPLLSPAYLQSQWCARELKLFTARRVIARATGMPGHVSAVVPVLWVPTERSGMPAVIREFQHFDPLGLAKPELAADYRDNGIYGLLRTKQDEAYHHVVWRLAMRIREIFLTYHVEVGAAPVEEAS
ncbi:TIR-like protein FxsC [Paractinoplanes durhamensis]|uniref:TIR domain-containing protein n=1 Tax=Paractinoplanes durhamensis TaxID=113563 RepID=A0ABQ3ZBD7_9ACTN|nr:TIR-like protein FxsC [Actinoplanes durhamensis]GIE07130.1 hypothetical protein Adu01nite_84800 [Actinoplanes durhamensis]